MLKELGAVTGDRPAVVQPVTAGASTVLASLRKKLAQCPELDLISFDVFDTVMTRSVGEPSSLFYLLGEQLLQRGILRGSPESFARVRHSASARARNAIAPPADVTLAEIYEEVVHGWPHLRPHVPEIMAAELELERSLSRPMPCGAAMIELARTHSRSIAFVSDMYLPEEFIRELLNGHGLARADDPVYVSNARRRMKSRGGALFDLVLEQQAVQPQRALHIGDKVQSDYSPAKARGMHAFLLPYGLLNRYEAALEERRSESRGLTSLLAGTSRLARLHALENGQHRAMTDVLAGVAGPLLCGFTMCLIERAQSAGIRRLYFLSREGQLLHDLARIVNERFQLGLDLRYLYVSRQSLNLALLTDPNEVNLAFAMTSTKSYSVRQVLERIGLQPADIEPELIAIELPSSAWDAPATPEGHSRLIKLLQEGRPRQVLVDRATEARALAEEYLEAEGLFEDHRIGLVDTTGIGSQLRTLNLLRRARVAADTEGFLVVRSWRQALEHDGFPPIHGYLADHHQKRGYGTLPGVVPMLEVFTRADHGTVLGYKRTNGTIQPLLHRAIDRGEAWDPARMRHVIKVYVREFVSCADSLRPETDARAGLVEAFRRFWEAPTPDEAEFWGSFPYECGSGSGHGLEELAPRLTVTDVLAQALWKRSTGKHWFTWRAAREERSAWPVRGLLWGGRWMKRAMGRVCRIAGLSPRRVQRYTRGGGRSGARPSDRQRLQDGAVHSHTSRSTTTRAPQVARGGDDSRSTV